MAILVAIVSTVLNIVLNSVVTVVHLGGMPMLGRLFVMFVSFVQNAPFLMRLFLVCFKMPRVVSRVKLGVGGIPNLMFMCTMFALRVTTCDTRVVHSDVSTITPNRGRTTGDLNVARFRDCIHVVLPRTFAVDVPPLAGLIVNVLGKATLVFGINIISVVHGTSLVNNGDRHCLRLFISTTVVCNVLVVVISLLNQLLRGHFAITNGRARHVLVDRR